MRFMAVPATRTRPHDRWSAACLLLFSAFALGQAVQAYNGALSPDAFVWLNVAVISAAVAALIPDWPWFEQRGALVATCLAAVALAQQFADLLTAPLAVYASSTPPGEQPPARWLAYSAVLGGLALVGRPSLRGRFLPLVIVPHLLLGLLILRSSPAPHIDVFIFQRDSAAALLSGHNPYTLTFPNIYGDSSPFYGPNMSVGGRLQFGYPYPPASLFITVVGHLFGDFRYAQLFAMEGAALCMLYARKGVMGAAAAMVYLFTPRTFFVLEQGWTEPYLVFLLAFAVLVACRWPRAVPFALAAFLAVKQYLVLAVLPALLLIPRPADRRTLLRYGAVVVGTVLALTLPLALWNWHAFFTDVIALQVHQPFRPDALSYLAWWNGKSGHPPPTALAFAAAAMATLGAMLRFARTPAGFASAVALVMLAFVSFNKQAFCNYYYFVIGALCTSVAAMRASYAKVELNHTGR